MGLLPNTLQDPGHEILVGSGAEDLPALDFSPPPEDSHSPHEHALARRLLGYLAACARATYRELGLHNVFDAGKPVIGLPADAWGALCKDGLVVKGKDAVDLVVAHRLSPAENPLFVGTLFLVGKRGRTTYCAPLLVARAQAETRRGNEVILTLEGDALELNVSLIAAVAGYVSEDEEEQLQHRLAELIDQIPDVPLDVEAANRFILALDVHLGTDFEFSPINTWVECDLVAELEEPRMRLVPTHAWFLGREVSAFTVVQELEALSGDGALDLAGTAFVEVMVPPGLGGPETVGEPEETTGATRIFQPPAPAFDHDFEILPLTDAQRQAVLAARSFPLTVITGPPGTGKSHTIAALILDHILGGQRVLITSRTEQAVKVVVEKLEEVAGPFVVARSGNRATQRELADKIERLLEPGGIGDVPSQEDVARLETRYHELRKRFAELVENISRCLGLVGTFSHHHDQMTSLEAEGIRVPGHVLRGVKPQRLRAMYERGQALLHGGFLSQFWGRRLIRAVRTRLVPHEDADDRLPEYIACVEHWQELERVWKQLQQLPRLSGAWSELERIDRELRKVAVEYLKAKRARQLASVLSDRRMRTALSYFKAALRAAEGRRKRELLNQVPVEVFLWVFPCWASTDRFLSHILPLQSRLFDQCVVDEASQCDLAAAAPALYRARRAVIVGDSKQLRHVTFLPRAMEVAAFARNGIPEHLRITHSFRRSLFDVAQDHAEHAATFLLDEHFRSLPSIIRFPTDRFYNGRLRIMTERPENESVHAVQVIYVDSPRDSVTGPNTGEANRVIELVREVMRTDPKVSVGILSPFRAQVDLLRQLVAQVFTPLEIEERKLVVGTAHVLQGDERDVVVVSFALDRHFHHNQLRWLEQETGVFNVSITRARKRLYVVSSVRPSDLPEGLLKHYLLYAESEMRPKVYQDQFDSNFEREVCHELRRRGLRVYTQYQSAGYKIDLVVTDGYRTVAVECDGPTHFRPDGRYTDEDVRRHLILRRAGWDLVHIPYYEWKEDPNGCLDRILARFGRDS